MSAERVLITTELLAEMLDALTARVQALESRPPVLVPDLAIQLAEARQLPEAQRIAVAQRVVTQLEEWGR